MSLSSSLISDEKAEAAENARCDSNAAQEANDCAQSAETARFDAQPAAVTSSVVDEEAKKARVYTRASVC